MNPNDEIRDAILRYLYEVHSKASSPKSAAVKISDLQKAMKDRHDYKRNLIGGNLDYLIQTGHALQVTEERTYRAEGGTVQSSPVVTYKISHKGVDRMQKASLFKQEPTGQQINVTTISGVTVVGDNNVVNTRYADLSQALGSLREELVRMDTLSEAAKLDVVADIDTIRSQLQKPEPDAGLIQRAWTGVERIANGAGAAEAVVKIAHLVSHIT